MNTHCQLIRSLTLLVISILFLQFPFDAIADCDVRFSWLPNSEPNLAGYKIYYGTDDGGPYTDEIDFGAGELVDGRIHGEIEGLPCGITYHFVCVAYNTNEEESDYSRQVTVTLQDPGNLIASSVFGDVSGADYPGTIEDTFISLNRTNNSSSINLNTYTWPTNMVANAIIMKIDVSSLPRGVQVATAELQLYANAAGGDSTYDISAHKIINHNPVLANATGYTYDGSQGWTANNSSYNNIPMAQADISAAADVNSINLSTGYKSWDITAMVQEWLAYPDTNYGVLLNADNNATQDSYRFFSSSEANDPGQRPRLTVTYSERLAPTIINIELE